MYIYIYIYIYTHTGVDTHMYHMRLSVYYDCYVSACVVCVTRFGLKVVDTGPRLGLNLVDITIYYVYIYIYIYIHMFYTPLRNRLGAFLGCCCWAQKGRIYFTELAERVEYGNYDNYTELIVDVICVG